MGLRDQRGQILLIVILVMIIALTVGLSIASRTITNIRIARQNEESQRAFQAAEAGIDQALSKIAGTDATISDNFENNSEFNTTLTSSEGDALLINGGEIVQQGVGADVWLSQYSDDPLLVFEDPMGDPIATDIVIYWGTSDQDDCTTDQDDADVIPALEVLLLTGDKQNPTYQKFVYDVSCGSGSRPIAGAELANVGSFTPVPGGTTFQYSTDPISISQGRIMKIIPIYNSGVIAIQSLDPDDAFPSQGSLIVSEGTSGDVKRKITLFSSYPQIPLEIFPYNIISQ